MSRQSSNISHATRGLPLSGAPRLCRIATEIAEHQQVEGIGMACVASVVASYRCLILLVRSEHQRWCDFLFGWGIFFA